MTDYYVDPQNSNVSTWQASTTYSVGNRAYPTNKAAASAGYIYECTVGGQSGGSEPTWVYTTPDVSTTTDNEVTWICRNPDSWTEALLGLQGAADRATAGDSVYCRGTQTLTAAIDFDTNSGSGGGSEIEFIGVNSSGVEDGTYFELDGNSTATNCCRGNVTGPDYIVFRNIWVHHSNGGAGWNWVGTGSSNNVAWVNCKASNCGTDGWHTYYSAAMYWLWCLAVNNGNDGFGRHYYGHIWLYCESYGNTQHGWGECTNIAQRPDYRFCVSADNGYDGFENVQQCRMLHCVIDGNGHHGIGAAGNYNHGCYIIGTRITNHSTASYYGLNNANARPRAYMFLEGNDTDVLTAGREIPDYTTGSDSNVTSGTIGYTSPGSPNYNYELTTSATLRNLPRKVGGLGGYTDTHMAAGLPVEDLGGGVSIPNTRRNIMIGR